MKRVGVSAPSFQGGCAKAGLVALAGCASRYLADVRRRVALAAVLGAGTGSGGSSVRATRWASRKLMISASRKRNLRLPGNRLAGIRPTAAPTYSVRRLSPRISATCSAL